MLQRRAKRLIRSGEIDILLEMTGGPVPTCALVECKDTAKPFSHKQVLDFSRNVEHARRLDSLPYQAIVVSKGGFRTEAYAAAQPEFVQLLTFEQLLLSLVDLGPSLEAAIAGFRGTALERLYVEQEVVLQSDLEPGKTPRALPLLETVREWLEAPTGSFLTLLGDFGSGKTSFCRRLASELALAARERPGRRAPVLIDLREGASTTVTLESLLTHHFQRLSSRAFNPQALLHLNREGYLVLLFDGFDEILGYAEPSRFLEILRQILRAAEGKAKVILTCRTHYFRDRPDEVKTLKPRPGVLTRRLGNCTNPSNKRASDSSSLAGRRTQLAACRFSRSRVQRARFKSATTTDEEVPMSEKMAPIHPGEILLEEFLEPLGLSQYRLAKEIHVPPRRINEIIHGKRAITADTALRLARFFETSERFWLNLQVRYDLEVERDRLGEQLGRDFAPLSALRALLA